MNKSFVFDLDGTLLDTGADLALSMNYALRTMGFPEKDKDVLVTYVGDGLEEYIHRAFETEDVKIEKKAKILFEDFYRNHNHEATILYDGVVETLKELQSRNAKLFVLSNKPIEFIPTLLKKLDIHEYFTDLIGQYSLPQIKPDPAGLYYLMKKYKLERQNMFMIGDNYTDIEAGASAQVKTVFCSFGLGRLSDVVPDFSIDTFKDLLKFI